MKIALVNVEKGSSPPSGADRYAANILSLLAEAEEIELPIHLYVHNNPNILKFYCGEFDDKKVKVHYYHPLIDTALAVVLWHLFILPVRLWWRGFDLIHVTNARPVLRRVLYTIHDVAEVQIPNKFDHLRTLYRKLLLHWWRHQSQLLTVSETAKKDICKAIGMPQDRIWVVPNTVRETPGEVNDKSPPASVAYLLYIGRIDHPSKNLTLLLEAFSLCRTEVNLTLAGADAWGSEVVHATARESVRSGRIHFTGFIDETERRSLMQSATALCIPSLHEGFGLPAVEAVYANLPVLFSDGGALPEVMGTKAGCLPSRDVMAWRDAMTRVATDSAFREELRREQRLGLGDRFKPDTVLSTLLASYRHGLQGHTKQVFKRRWESK